MHTPNFILEQHALQVLQASIQETYLGLSGKLGMAIYLMEYSRVTEIGNFCLIGSAYSQKFFKRFLYKLVRLAIKMELLVSGLG